MTRLPRILFVLASAIVIGAVMTGIMMIDSPGAERLKRLDRARMELVLDMSNAADCAWMESGEFPETLIPLVGRAQPPGLDYCYLPNINDPVSGEPLEYRRLDDGFEICAVFATDHRARSGSRVGGRASAAVIQRFRLQNHGSHPAGHHCFRFDPLEIEEN